MIKELECTKQVMQTAIAQQSLSSSPQAAFLLVHMLSLLLCGAEHSFGPLGSAVLPVSPQSPCCGLDVM